jgi:hypothetical protein
MAYFLPFRTWFTLCLRVFGILLIPAYFDKAEIILSYTLTPS